MQENGWLLYITLIQVDFVHTIVLKELPIITVYTDHEAKFFCTYYY